MFFAADDTYSSFWVIVIEDCMFVGDGVGRNWGLVGCTGFIPDAGCLSFVAGANVAVGMDLFVLSVLVLGVSTFDVLDSAIVVCSVGGLLCKPVLFPAQAVNSSMTIKLRLHFWAIIVDTLSIV